MILAVAGGPSGPRKEKMLRSPVEHRLAGLNQQHQQHVMATPHKSDRSSIYVVVGIFLFWFSLLFFSGVLSSGYHFTDDHEILGLSRALSNSHNDIIQVSQKWISHDLKIRFRPFYYLHRIFETSLFGMNLSLWFIYTGILAVLTSCFLYFFSKTIGFTTLESLAFSVFPFVGQQSPIWWRLGPSEGLAVFLMSLALLFMAMSVYVERGRIWYEILFVVFTVLMSLSKESFILLIPAIIFWKIWLDQEKRKLNWIHAITNNALSSGTLVLVFLIELLLVVFYVGTTKLGYAGVEGFQPMLYLKTAIKLSTVGGSERILGIGIFLVFLVSFIKSGRVIRKGFIYSVFLFLLMVIPQIILYAQSGFYGRYLIPAIMGYCVLMLYLLRFLRISNVNIGLALGADLKRIFRNVLLISGIVAVLLGTLVLTGETFEGFLLFVVSLIKGKAGGPHWPDKVRTLSIVSVLVGLTLSVGAGVAIQERWNCKSLSITSLLWLVIGYFFVVNAAVASERARDFAREGKATAAFLGSTIVNAKSEDDVILIATDGVRSYEWSISMREYLKSVGKRNVYFYEIVRNEKYNDFHKRLIESFRIYAGENKFENIRNKENIRCVSIFPKGEKAFLDQAKTWFKDKEFSREDYDGFVVYARKGKRQ